MKIAVLIFCFTLCFLSKKTGASENQEHRYRMAMPSHMKKQLCLDNCVVPTKCYNVAEFFAYVMRKPDVCRDQVEKRCENNGLHIMQKLTSCFKMALENLTDCQPQTDEYVSRQAACSECKKNCSAERTTDATASSIEPAPEGSGEVDQRVNTEKPQEVESTTATPSFTNVTECANHCGQSERCNLTTGTEGMLQGQTDGCKRCVQRRCKNANEPPVNCSSCLKLEKMSCYEEALGGCWNCTEVSEDIEDNLKRCQECMGDCIEEYGDYDDKNDRDEHDDDHTIRDEHDDDHNDRDEEGNDRGDSIGYNIFSWFDEK